MPEEIFETPQTTEPKPTNWPKILLVAVLGFALLAGAAYAGYWYGTESAKVETTTPTATQPSTSNLTEPPGEVQGETYSGKHFSLTLSREWQIDPNYKPPSGSSNVNILEAVRFITSRSMEKESGVGFATGLAHISIGVATYTPSFIPSEKSEKVKLSGQDATKMSGHTGMDNSVYFVTVVTEHNGNTYQLDLETQDEDLKDIFEAEFNNILSTFKFLEVEDQTKDWETYTNNKYSFALDYPSDFYVQIEGSGVELGPDEVKVVVRLAKSGDISHPVVDVSVTRTDLTTEEWINTHRCGSLLSTGLKETGLCSPITAGAIPNSLQVQTTEEVHYQSVDTVLKRDNLLFDIIVGATNPDIGITDNALAIYNQILTTFKFLD